MRGKTHGYPVRLGLLAPFGGITRIRFKGFVKDVSAIRLPRTYFFQAKTGAREVNSCRLFSTTKNTESTKMKLISPRKKTEAQSSCLSRTSR